MKQLIISLIAMAWAMAAHAQSGAVTVNANRTITVPAAGNFTGPITTNGTITGGNLTTAGILTGAGLRLTMPSSFDADGWTHPYGGSALLGSGYESYYGSTYQFLVPDTNGAQDARFWGMVNDTGTLYLSYTQPSSTQGGADGYQGNAMAFTAGGAIQGYLPAFFSSNLTAQNLISNATATVGNLTTNGTTTTSALTLTSGNITDNDGDVIINDYLQVKVSSGDARIYTDGTALSGLIIRQSGTEKTQYVFAGGSTYIDYTGDFYFRNNIGGSINGLELPDTGGIKLGGSSATTISGVYSAAASIDFASTSAQTTNSGNTITVTGVSTTNTPSVQIGLGADLPTGCSVYGRVTASNTVTLYFVNASASAQDPGAITIRATVTQF